MLGCATHRAHDHHSSRRRPQRRPARGLRPRGDPRLSRSSAATRRRRSWTIPNVAVVDIGGVHDPARSNFDHHHFPREHPPTCALSLVLDHLGLYQDALQFCDWLETAEWFDSRGPKKTGEWLGVPRRAISQLNSPIDMTLLRRFAQTTRLEPDGPALRVHEDGRRRSPRVPARRARAPRLHRQARRALDDPVRRRRDRGALPAAHRRRGRRAELRCSAATSARRSSTA